MLWTASLHRVYAYVDELAQITKWNKFMIQYYSLMTANTR